nr:hypothetical protein [Mycobacterium sp. SM1]
MITTGRDPAIETVDARLTAIAFGSQPGLWPLPAARTPQQLWLRAVAAAGQGRYGSARADLAALLRGRPPGRLASLAHSAQGSFLRQLGWHQVARRWDGRALALAGTDPEATGDALIGLAADALGVGRFAVAGTLLSRAGSILTAFEGSPEPALRLAVRLEWVTAELAMAVGDGAAAVGHAQRAVEAARTGFASVRHRVKSQAILAAALCGSGTLDRARVIADAALDACGRLGLIPLRWALACLLIDIESSRYPTQYLCTIRDGCVQQVRRGGGTWYGR